MSDIDTAFSEAMAELSAEAEVVPADSGQVDVGADTTDVTETEGTSSADDFFDISQYADKKVRVKVGGEELAVPVADLANGYQRQADYTRKTQELAAQREQAQFALQLQQALEVNPVETLRLLSTAYGVELTPAQQAVVDAADDADQFIDPVERVLNERLNERLAPIQSTLEAFERERAVRQIEADVASLRSKYGEAFNEQAVIQTAVQWGETDLEKVFKLLAFDSLMAQQQAVGDFTQAQAAEDAARLQAKAEMAGLVSSGSSAASAVPAATRTNTLEDAFYEALAEHGVTL